MRRAALFALLLLAACSSPKPVEETAQTDRLVAAEQRNVLVILLDTVRDDRIGQRGITPNIDELATRSVVFKNAYSNSGWTLPAHASLFTGLYPVQHRATQETLALGIDFPTLAETFSAAGWSTFGASANGVVSEANGLARGFERFEETFRNDVVSRFSGRGHVNEGALLDFLDGNGDKPWFAFLNFIEAHLPYRAPRAFIDRFVDSDRYSAEQIAFAQRVKMRDHYLTPDGLPAELMTLMSQLYDAEVAALDSYVGHMLDTLEQRGLLENTTIVLMSDHGENLGEHGHFAHVFDLHNTLVEIPLMVHVPGVAGGSRTDVAQIVDLFPTLLALNGIESALDVHGRDLFAAGAAQREVMVVAEYYYPRQVLSVFKPDELEALGDRFAPYLVRQRVAQDGHRKWWWKSSQARGAFDLVEDPGELTNRAASGRPPREWRSLAELLDGFVENYEGLVPLIEAPPAGWMMPGFESTIDDPELLERLKALGYVH